MSTKMIQEKLDSYGCKTAIEEEQAIREITQEIALAALGRTDFFNNAIFHGGTCLRIFYGLNRFSEDMDFVLRQPNSNFDLKPSLNALILELEAYGYRIEIVDRTSSRSAIKKAFLKDNSLGKLIKLHFAGQKGPLRKIQIKFEVDTNPPPGGAIEQKYLDFPFISSVITYSPSSLFAGKIHALLCREYLKGRDWYDFLWYTAQKSPVNFELLSASLKQIGPWKNENIKVDDIWIKEKLENKIKSINWHSVAEDVKRFIKTDELPSLALWSESLFLNQLNKINVNM